MVIFLVNAGKTDRLTSFKAEILTRIAICYLFGKDFALYFNNFYKESTMSELKSYETVSSSPSHSATAGSQAGTAAASEIMNKVFMWMTVGLALTGSTALWFASSPLILQLTPMTMIVLFLVQLGLVFWLSARVMSMQPTTAILVFLVYSALTGVTLAPIFLVYTSASIGTTFLITAATFGVMATYGIVTNQDLTKVGNIAFMALIGLIIASVVNWFLQSPVMHYIISGIGVLVFTALTAYDAQKIKEMSHQLQGESQDVQTRASILGALSLYLDFINLFIMLLQFFGARRD